MNPIIKNLLGSFDNSTNSWGAKRLTAFAFMTLIYISHIVIFCYVIWAKDDLKIRTSFKLVEYFFYTDCIMLALLLGIITSQQLIEFKNGRNEKNNPTNTDSNND
jgi:hypothetical protein